jgi:hypothetical protein
LFGKIMSNRFVKGGICVPLWSIVNGQD